MARRSSADTRKTALLVGNELVKILEEEPVERFGQTFIWCDVLGVPTNPWLVNVDHIVRIEA